MFLQRKFIQMLTIYFIGILSISNAQINSPEEPQSPKLIPKIDDAKVYELHQYLLDNKSIFKNHLILMSHPKYYILLNEIIKKMNEVILYNNDQPVIDKKELKNIGLPQDHWAIRITYIVTWGENAKDGQNAMQAGLKRGDIVYSVNGKSDFISTQHFQSWFRLNMKPGRKVEFRLLRNKTKKRVLMKVLP